MENCYAATFQKVINSGNTSCQSFWSLSMSRADLCLVFVQCCAQKVISGGKFPRGIKRRGQPCACVRRTYLAGGWGCGEKAGIITGIIKLLLWSRSTGHYLGIIGRILEEY